MYQALYRKYRPKVFADVVGQEHVTRTLMNEIRTGRHSHAYLFTGSRGTGKTTCAKIFAKAVNCEHPVNGDPCNECATCRGIDSGAVMDVVEIDAASNNGVDSIRDIRDEANFTPVNGKYRVYIIDEVHMLSTGAFNALLKTLEEPPAHVKFILATTEVHKLPATILSRCQRFDFKRISPEDIAGRVLYVADQEHLNVTQNAANLIARLADGALRDALSILDQCMGHGTDIDENVVNEVVGLTGRTHLFALADSILQRDSASALDQINELHSRSCDMERLCSELINHFRNLMVCRAVSDPQNLIVCSPQELADYEEEAQDCNMQDIMHVLNVLGETLTYMRKGLNRRVEMEMAVIRLCGEEPAGAPQEIPSPVPRPRRHAKPAPKKAEPKPAPAEDIPLPDDFAAPPPEDEEVPLPPPPQEEAPAAPERPQPEPRHEPEPVPESEGGPAPEEMPAASNSVDAVILPQEWEAFSHLLQEKDKRFIGALTGSKAVRRGGSLFIHSDMPLLKSFLKQEELRRKVQEAAEEQFGQPLQPMLVDAAAFRREKDAVSGKAAESKQKPKSITGDPLEQFVKKAEDLGLPIEIKE